MNIKKYLYLGAFTSTALSKDTYHEAYECRLLLSCWVALPAIATALGSQSSTGPRSSCTASPGLRTLQTNETLCWIIR